MGAAIEQGDAKAGGTGRVSRPDGDAKLSPSGVRRELTNSCSTVPPSVHGGYVIHLSANEVPNGLDIESVGLQLPWIGWIEMEVQRSGDLVERMRR